MKFYKSIFVLFFALASCLIPYNNVYAGLPIIDTDYLDWQLVGSFDLRDRESFIQITNTDNFPLGHTIHIQIFNVGNLCNENNFFDVYTINDTHVYNLRDIVTNDGNPAGFVLPDDAYGIFVATVEAQGTGIIGNQRIIDNNGYEYRTNLGAIGFRAADTSPDVYTFNYNTEGGVILSDVVGIMLDCIDFSCDDDSEVTAADILNIWASWDIDIYDLNEVPFSCRDVNFACTDQDNPLLEETLEQINNDSGSGNVVSFEYGINEAIPSSRMPRSFAPAM